MKHLFLFIGLLIFVGFFTSCSEDNFDTTDTTTEQEDVELTSSQNNIMTRASFTGETSDVLLFGCISVEYPFILIDLDGNDVLISNEEEYESVVYDSSSTRVEIVDFKYPFTAIDSDGNSVVIQDAEKIAELFSACIPDIVWDGEELPVFLIDEANACYSLMYPVGLRNAAGESITVNDREELLDAVTEEVVYFNFPFGLLTAAGDERVINNIDDFYNAIIDCNGLDNDTPDNYWDFTFDFTGCFDLEFPLTVINKDGVTIQVSDHEELCDLMIGGEVQDYVFPLNIINENGVVEVVNSSEELDAYAISCFDFGEEDFDDILLLLSKSGAYGEPVCYSIDYPITIVRTDTLGNTETIDIANNEEARSTDISGYRLDYPVGITYVDGTTSTIANYEGVLELYSTCPDAYVEEGVRVGFLLEGEGSCYEIVFPIQATAFDKATWEENGTLTIQKTYETKADFLADRINILYVDYGFSVILNLNGNEVEINNVEVLNDLLENC